MYVFNFRGIGKLLQLLKYEMKYSIIFKYDFFKCVFFCQLKVFKQVLWLNANTDLITK